jgi:hypothetical protein
MSKHRKLRKEIIYWHDVRNPPPYTGRYLAALDEAYNGLCGVDTIITATYDTNTGVWYEFTTPVFNVHSWATLPVGPD